MPNPNSGAAQPVNVEFKRPQTSSDFAALSIEHKLELMLLAEEAFLGWGYVDITASGIEGPQVVEQTWFPKLHLRRTLEDLTTQDIRIISQTIDYALDIFIRPCYLDMSTVLKDSDSLMFPTTNFIRGGDSRPSIVLANGRTRVKIARFLASESSGSIPWLAKFYDMDHLKDHPLSRELKFVIIED